VRDTGPVSELSSWRAPVAKAAIDATVDVPASKSLMARHLVLAALADEPTTLHNPLVARDSSLMADALRRLGASVAAPTSGPWTVLPRQHPAGGAVDCGLSGTVMRFVPPLAALSDATVAFDGDPRARARPMAGLLDALRALGVAVFPDGATGLPFTIEGTGTVGGGTVTVEARESSQYVSGMLMAACRFAEGLVLHTVGAPPSTPHVTMTVETMRARGLDVAASAPTTWTVRRGVPTGGDVTVEPDLSNAAPFLAAAVATGGTVRVPGWPQRTTQPSDDLLYLLDRLGAVVALDDGMLTLRGPGTITALGTTDMSAVGELVPTVVALAALADGETTVTGVAHLRGHETDRLAALTRALRGLGGRVCETHDGLRVTPTPLRAGTVAAEGDHRMATFGAILGLVVPGVVVDDVTVTTKTMPDFAQRWQAMLG
jgi:3-phosphoshikimate 1-carboxyvinyltransferase